MNYQELAQVGGRGRFYDVWDSRLTADETEHIRKIAAFADDHLLPLACDSASAAPIPRNVVGLWGQQGFPGLQSPVARGGLGASYFAKICMVQELARRSFACAFSLNNMQSLTLTIATHENQEVRDRYAAKLLRGELIASVGLTEPGGGSDLAAMKTCATKVQGGWILNGEKAWITNAAISDIAVVSAQTATGTKGIARFVVELNAEGVQRLPAHDVSTAHLIGLGGFTMTDHFVSDALVLDPPGAAFKKAMRSINGARVHVAAMCVAAAEACLRTAIRYSVQREAFGKRLLDHQGLKWQLVDVANTLEAANLLVYRGAEMVEAGQDATLAASHAKKFAAETAIHCIESCAQIFGARAASRLLPFSRQIAEVKLAAFADGTTEIQKERIGNYLESHYAN